VLHAVVLTQYRRVTDGQTDGIAVASTALAMRALRRAVKIAIPAKGAWPKWPNGKYAAGYGYYGVTRHLQND